MIYPLTSPFIVFLKTIQYYGRRVGNSRRDIQQMFLGDEAALDAFRQLTLELYRHSDVFLRQRIYPVWLTTPTNVLCICDWVTHEELIDDDHHTNFREGIADHFNEFANIQIPRIVNGVPERGAGKVSVTAASMKMEHF